MTAQDTMHMAADKVLKECPWDEIEDMFKPINGFDLLLRLDFKGAVNKAYGWITNDAPDAMPHRFRSPYSAQLRRSIEFERFYRIIKRKRRKIMEETVEVPLSLFKELKEYIEERTAIKTPVAERRALIEWSIKLKTAEKNHSANDC